MGIWCFFCSFGQFVRTFCWLNVCGDQVTRWADGRAGYIMSCHVMSNDDNNYNLTRFFFFFAVLVFAVGVPVLGSLFN